MPNAQNLMTNEAVAAPPGHWSLGIGHLLVIGAWSLAIPPPYHSSMDLFGDVRRKNLARSAPLAVRMRPRTLEEFVGLHPFLAPGKLLRLMLAADWPNRVILYRPPGP